MASTSILLLLCALVLGAASGQGYHQGQGGGNFVGGRKQQEGAAGFRSDGEGVGAQRGVEDARQYNFRIYTEPEYYGYESKFPGGKAMYKSYRSGLGADGGHSRNNNFGSRGGQQQQPQN